MCYTSESSFFYLQKVVFKFHSNCNLHKYPGQLLFWIMLLINEVSGSNFFSKGTSCFWTEEFPNIHCPSFPSLSSKYRSPMSTGAILSIHRFFHHWTQGCVLTWTCFNCCFTVFLFFHSPRRNLHFVNFNLANKAVEIKFQLFMFIRTW